MSAQHTAIATNRVLVQDGTYEFRGTIKKDGATYSVAAKTITATIRSKENPTVPLNASYEDISVTAGNSETAAASGGVTFSFSPSSTYFFAPPDPTEWETYYIQFYISNDDYYPQLVEFGVRIKLD